MNLLATLVRLVVAVFLGVLLGLLVTIVTLDRVNKSVVAGPWRGAPLGGTQTDPYALAADSRASLLPIGTAEGLSFITETDSKGVGLAGRCDYLVKGSVPSTRFWTLSLLTPDGFPVANPASHYAFTSADVLRINDEPLEINVSADARSGNWLPSGEAKHYVLMLRLYDTGLSTVGTVLRADDMPSIRKVGCK